MSTTTQEVKYTSQGFQVLMHCMGYGYKRSRTARSISRLAMLTVRSTSAALGALRKKGLVECQNRYEWVLTDQGLRQLAAGFAQMRSTEGWVVITQDSPNLKAYKAYDVCCSRRLGTTTIRRIWPRTEELAEAPPNRCLSHVVIAPEAAQDFLMGDRVKDAAVTA